MYRTFINDVKTGRIGNLCLMYGCERFLLDKAVEELKNSVVTGLRELNLTIFENDMLNLADLMNACNTLPFGSDKRLVLVKDYDGLFSKSSQGNDEIYEESFISQLPDFTCLVFVNHGNVDGRKKLFKEISKKGKIYKFDKLCKEDLTQWVRAHFKRKGKEIDISALEYFVDNIGYLDRSSEANLYHVQNEIKKILAYAEENGMVTVELIKNFFGRTLENDIFKLIDASWRKNISGSLKMYNDLKLSGESSFGILAMLSKGIKNLIKIKELKTQGFKAKEISKHAQIHEYTVKLYLTHTDKMSFEILEKALNKCLKCEKEIKTGKMSEHLAMEMLLASLFE